MLCTRGRCWNAKDIWCWNIFRSIISLAFILYLYFFSALWTHRFWCSRFNVRGTLVLVSPLVLVSTLVSVLLDFLKALLIIVIQFDVWKCTLFIQIVLFLYKMYSFYAKLLPPRPLLEIREPRVLKAMASVFFSFMRIAPPYSQLPQAWLETPVTKVLKGRLRSSA